MNGDMQEKASIMAVCTDIHFLLARSLFGITQQSLVMPNSDPQDGNFCPYLTAMKDTYTYSDLLGGTDLQCAHWFFTKN